MMGHGSNRAVWLLARVTQARRPDTQSCAGTSMAPAASGVDARRMLKPAGREDEKCGCLGFEFACALYGVPWLGRAPELADWRLCDCGGTSPSMRRGIPYFVRASSYHIILGALPRFS